MSVKKSDDYMVACPFFLCQSSTAIVCEGFIEGVSVKMDFHQKASKREHRQLYCEDIKKCSECPVYKMTDLKYR